MFLLRYLSFQVSKGFFRMVLHLTWLYLKLKKFVISVDKLNGILPSTSKFRKQTFHPLHVTYFRRPPALHSVNSLFHI